MATATQHTTEAEILLLLRGACGIVQLVENISLIACYT